MPNRDYVVRSKPKKNRNKFIIVLFIVIILSSVAGGLWFLTKSGSENKIQKHQLKPLSSKTSLPSRPEETYSYIRDLETREVPIGKNSKYSQLTKDQEQQILKQQELEKQKLEKLSPAEHSSAKKIEQERIAKPATMEEPSSFEKSSKISEQNKAENKNNLSESPTGTKQTLETAKAKTSGKYGLQCGAFKNKAQAENMQARLAMAGYNAKISSSDWHRVFVGPIGDRNAAAAAKSNARSVAECLIIGM